MPTGTQPVSPTGAQPAMAVRIESDPPGAEVLIDGALIGQTPLSLPRPRTGEHAIVLRQRGYMDARVLVLPTTGEVLAVTLERGRRVTGTMAPETETRMSDPVVEMVQPPSDSMTVRHASDVVDPWE